MRLLLDTHTFIWFLNGDSQLSQKVKGFIADKSNRCFISIASLWEIAIKSNLGKLKLAGPFEELLDFLLINTIEILPITFEHTCYILKLPFHHRDPFDRIIIAQAITEKLLLASKDSAFTFYEVDTIWE